MSLKIHFETVNVMKYHKINKLGTYVTTKQSTVSFRKDVRLIPLERCMDKAREMTEEDKNSTTKNDENKNSTTEILKCFAQERLSLTRTDDMVRIRDTEESSTEKVRKYLNSTTTNIGRETIEIGTGDSSSSTSNFSTNAERKIISATHFKRTPIRADQFMTATNDPIKRAQYYDANGESVEGKLYINIEDVTFEADEIASSAGDFQSDAVKVCFAYSASNGENTESKIDSSNNLDDMDLAQSKTLPTPPIEAIVRIYGDGGIRTRLFSEHIKDFSSSSTGKNNSKKHSNSKSINSQIREYCTEPIQFNLNNMKIDIHILQVLPPSQAKFLGISIPKADACVMPLDIGQIWQGEVKNLNFKKSQSENTSITPLDGWRWRPDALRVFEKHESNFRHNSTSNHDNITSFGLEFHERLSFGFNSEYEFGGPNHDSYGDAEIYKRMENRDEKSVPKTSKVNFPKKTICFVGDSLIRHLYMSSVKVFEDAKFSDELLYDKNHNFLQEGSQCFYGLVKPRNNCVLTEKKKYLNEKGIDNSYSELGLVIESEKKPEISRYYKNKNLYFAAKYIRLADLRDIHSFLYEKVLPEVNATCSDVVFNIGQWPLGSK